MLDRIHGKVMNEENYLDSKCVIDNY